MSLIFAKWNGSTITIDEYNKDIHTHVTCSLGHKLCGKKGTLKIHHFAHFSNEICDPWKEHEMSEWHKSLQEMIVDRSLIEYRIERNGILHIADIYNSEKELVIEVQHSPISIEKIRERENFYQNMIWIFDCTSKEKIYPTDYFLSGKIQYVILQTKTKYWISCYKQIFYDIGYGMAEFIACTNEHSCQILCRFYQYRDFFNCFFPKYYLIEKYSHNFPDPEDFSVTLNLSEKKLSKLSKIPCDKRPKLMIMKLENETILQVRKYILEPTNRMDFDKIIESLNFLGLSSSFLITSYGACIIFSEKGKSPLPREYSFKRKQLPKWETMSANNLIWNQL